MWGCVQNFSILARYLVWSAGSVKFSLEFPPVRTTLVTTLQMVFFRGKVCYFRFRYSTLFFKEFKDILNFSRNSRIKCPFLNSRTTLCNTPEYVFQTSLLSFEIIVFINVLLQMLNGLECMFLLNNCTLWELSKMELHIKFGQKLHSQWIFLWR